MTCPEKPGSLRKKCDRAREGSHDKRKKGIALCVLETKGEENARETGFVEMPEKAAELQEKGADYSLKDITFLGAKKGNA